MNAIHLMAAARNGKHIFMPEKDAKAILSILRSGEVKQGKGALFDGLGYCCLGVMQCYKSGGKVQVWDIEDAKKRGVGKSSKGFPSREWLGKVRWKFTDKFGHIHDDPFLPRFGYSASAANDKGKSFKEIADAMEEAIQYT